MNRPFIMVLYFVACYLMASTMAWAGVVTFEGIDPPAPTNAMSAQLTFAVNGFTFTNSRPTPAGTQSWFYYTPNEWNNFDGYRIGVRGTTAVYGGWYDAASAPSDITYDISRADGGFWEFNGAWITAVAGTGSIRMVGVLGGYDIYDFSKSISNTESRFIKKTDYPGQSVWINTLRITCDISSGSGVRNFVMDDLLYTLPAPGASAFLVLGMLGIRGRRR